MAGRFGLSLEIPGLSLADMEPVVRAAEAAGYTDAWPGEVAGRDASTPLALASTRTERMRLGTGVVGVFTRGPAIIAQHAATMQEASGGRFCLGIGSSSSVIVEQRNGVPFEKPLTRVREAVEFVRAALAGERAPGGFKLEIPPAQPVPIVIGALRGRMLALAGELGDGAFLNFLPLASVEQVVEQVRAVPTPRCPCTRSSSAGWGTARRSTRWSRRGGRATGRRRSRLRRGT